MSNKITSVELTEDKDENNDILEKKNEEHVEHIAVQLEGKVDGVISETMKTNLGTVINIQENVLIRKNFQSDELIVVVKETTEDHAKENLLDEHIEQQIPSADLNEVELVQENIVADLENECTMLIDNNETNKTVDCTNQLESIEESNTNTSGTVCIDSILPSTNVLKEKQISSGLSLLSQYESDAGDSDVEFVTEVASNSNVYRNKVIAIDSESDSTDSDDSSEESANTEKEVEGGRSLRRLHKTIDKRINTVSDDDEDDDMEIDENGVKKFRNRGKQTKVKGEMLLEDLPPIEDLQITVPEEECVELGRVHSVVDQLLLVSVLQNSLLLDLDTVLFLDKGKRVLGEIFDVLGQVAEPLYCIRFNSNAQIKEKNINVGDVVYVAPKTDYTQFVILSNLMKMRGSDASWEFDIEPPPRYLDYSDDEQERLGRARARNKERQEPARHVFQQKRSCGETVEITEDNEDDDDDNASVASHSTTASVEPTRFQRSNRGRGRGRGRGYNRGASYTATFGDSPIINSDSWHSNFYQAPPHYGQYPYPVPNYPPHMPPYNYPPPHSHYASYPMRPPMLNYSQPPNWGPSTSSQAPTWTREPPTQQPSRGPRHRGSYQGHEQ